MLEDEHCINLNKVLKLYKQVFRKYGKFADEICCVECKATGGLCKHRLGQKLALGLAAIIEGLELET